MIHSIPETFGLYRISLYGLTHWRDKVEVFNLVPKQGGHSENDNLDDMEVVTTLNEGIVFILDIVEYNWNECIYHGIHIIGKGFAGYINTDNYARRDLTVNFEKI